MAKKTVAKRKIEVSHNPYELMLILNPELRETEVEKKLKEITDIIEKAGGKITHEDFWGKKKLAYKIKTNWEGIYMVYDLELPNTFIEELKGIFRIEKELLRSMILKLPEGYTYTKFDLEETEEEPRRKKEPAKAAPAKKKEEIKEEVKEEKSAPVPSEPEVSEVKEKEEVIEEEKPAEPEKCPKCGGEMIDDHVCPEEEEKKEKEEKKEEEAPVDVSAEASAKVEPEAEEKPEKEEKEEKKYKSELDRKLDEILEGDDLNL